MEFVWKDDQYSDDGCSYKYQKIIQKNNEYSEAE